MNFKFCVKRGPSIRSAQVVLDDVSVRQAPMPEVTRIEIFSCSCKDVQFIPQAINTASSQHEYAAVFRAADQNFFFARESAYETEVGGAFSLALARAPTKKWLMTLRADLLQQMRWN